MVAGIALAISLLAAPAGALVMTVGGTKAGIQPRSTLLRSSEINLSEKFALEPSEFNNSQGHPVVSASKIYAIYWDPTDHYHGDWQHLIDTFLQGLSRASGHLDEVFAVDAQYTDAANQHPLYKAAFQGAYTDTDPYPSSGCTDPEPLNNADLIGAEVNKKHTQVCLTNRQIQEE